MLLETLLWEGFVAPAQISDRELSAVVKCDASNATLALRLDNDALRRALNAMDRPLCDGLFIGLSRPVDQEARIYCLFVELKGRDVPYAVQQLHNAMKLVRDHLLGTLAQHAMGRTRFSAVIVSDRAAPERDVTREDVLQFRRELRSTLHIQHASRRGPPADLTRYLWRLPDPST